MWLDIGSSSIRLLQLSRHGSSYRIDHFAIEPLPSGVIVEKSVQDIEAISDAIQSAVRNSGSNSKYCAVAVSGSAVFTKTISLPADLAEADIESQVQIEANQYIPYPLDEISLDFEVLGASPRNADMVDILLAASKNENVESRQDALEALGLKAKVVDVESFAIANAFELIRERDGIRSTETIGIFDIGFDLSTLLNFVSSADIIGGNSGSPVIDQNQQVVGLIFDGNIESLPGDYIYLPEKNRSVAVDVRGMLEALAEVYMAHRIVEELTAGILVGG